MRAQLTPEADLDAQHAIQWYDERSRELGDDFLRKVNECITSIEKSPEMYPFVHREMRRALLARFPYAVLYEIEDNAIIFMRSTIARAIRRHGSGDGAQAAREPHCARNPETWKRRRGASGA